MEREREIDYSGHDHPLVFVVLGKEEIQWCSTCQSGIFSYNNAYCCFKCRFYIHSSCSELQREIQHPCHPQHKLTLVRDIKFNCSLCREWSCESLGYHCEKCTFDIDPYCADHLITPTKQRISQQLQIHKKVTHQHPLIIFDVKSGFHGKCFSCRLPLTKSPIYFCTECKLLLDESCATLPKEIQHPFHKQHRLTLRVYSDFNTTCRYKCNACGVPIRGIFFNCLSCNFDLDVVCASLMPISTNHDNDKSDVKEIDPECVVTHPHPLITCYKTKDSFPFSCSACEQPLAKEDSIYVCLYCLRLLHKSCACLPRQILKHPYHPQHILILFDEKGGFSNYNGSRCAACTYGWHSGSGIFAYQCRDCNFLLHGKCALPAAPLINSQLHKQHPLALLDIQAYSTCNACTRLFSYPFFKCLRCVFNLHVHCLPVLPPTVKYKWHSHPLTLTNSPIKDYEDEDDTVEFYCDACEKHRLLDEPTYYCAKCHYVAHVHCVISEILPALQSEEDVAEKEEEKIVVDHKVTDRSDDSSKETREELKNNIVGDPVLAEIDTNIANMETGLNELKAQFEVLARQIEAQTKKLEQLKESRAQHLLSKEQ